MNRSSRWVLAGGAVLALTLLVGLSRLELDVDVFSLLPADSAIVEGLSHYQRNFGSARGLVVSVRSSDAKTTAHAAAALAKALAASPLAGSVVWRGTTDTQAVADLTAYAWLNQPPERFDQLFERLGDGRQGRLELTLEQMATSLQAEDVARLGRDPYDLSSILSDAAGLSGNGMASPFVSADGLLRVLFVEPPFEDTGFLRLRRWTGQVRELVERARQGGALGDEVTLRLTGNPAFVSEFGSGLLRDMSWAALGTLMLVAVLFWVAHRDWRPLLRLVTVLVIVLAVATALAGLLLRELNVLSLGFAAILLGLAADYGLILYQERKSHPDKTAAEHRRAVAPSILWAAVTTAGAFFMLTRSSLPGVAQLGTLVAIGILVAAALMLLGFLAARAPVVAASSPAHGALAGALGSAWSARVARVVTLLLGLIALAVLVARGLPSVDYGTTQLGPKAGAARAAWTEIETEIGGLEDSLWLIVAGATVPDVDERMQRARTLLEQARAAETLSGYRLPVELWPKLFFQQANWAKLPKLVTLRASARDDAVASGFTPASLALTEAVFDNWGGLAPADGVVWPRGETIGWMLRQFVARDEAGYLLLGRVEPAPGATIAELSALAQALRETTQAKLVGWSLLSESLIGVLERDLRRVLVPMAVVLVVLLGAAFRSVAAVCLSLLSLAVSLLALLAVMSLAGWSWNLMNVMALALLLGAGVDYSIHVQLAMQRNAGDANRMRRTVGQAILLCALSTAAGFGTLGFASNAGLASLGKVCATGIILAGLVSVFLLPAWWQGLAHRAPRTEGRRSQC